MQKRRPVTVWIQALGEKVAAATHKLLIVPLATEKKSHAESYLALPHFLA